MTANDEISVRGRFLVEVEDAEARLVLQQERARQTARLMREVASALERGAEYLPSGEDCMAGPLPTQQLPQTIYKPSLNYDEIIAMLLELKQTRQEVYNLRQRKSRMGGRFRGAA
jgi:hypothetical protein